MQGYVWGMKLIRQPLIKRGAVNLNIMVFCSWVGQFSLSVDFVCDGDE